MLLIRYMVFPLAFAPITAQELAAAEEEPPLQAGGGGGGHRRQLQDATAEDYEGLRISVKTKATTTRGAKNAFAEYVTAVGAHLDFDQEQAAGGGKSCIHHSVEASSIEH